VQSFVSRLTLYTSLTFYFDQINLFYFHFESCLVIKQSHSEPGGGDVPYRNSKLLNGVAWDRYCSACVLEHSDTCFWKSSGKSET